MEYIKPSVGTENDGHMEPAVLPGLVGAAIGAFLAGLVVGYFANP